MPSPTRARRPRRSNSRTPRPSEAQEYAIPAPRPSALPLDTIPAPPPAQSLTAEEYERIRAAYIHLGADEAAAAILADAAEERILSDESELDEELGQYELRRSWRAHWEMRGEL